MTEAGKRLTVCQSCKCIIQPQRLSRSRELAKATKKNGHVAVDQRLQPPDALLGKVWRQSSSADTVLVMSKRADETLVDAKRPGDPIPFVPLATAAGVDGVVEVRVCDVDFVGVDSDNGALEESATGVAGWHANITVFFV